MDKKSFGAEISEKIADQFIDYCNQSGFTKYRAVEAALRMFLVLPPQIQLRLMHSKKVDAYESLVEAVRDMELTKYFESMTSEARDELLAMSTDWHIKHFPEKFRKRHKKQE